MKELETLARKEIKGETSHLESLLSVLSPSDEVSPPVPRCSPPVPRKG